MTFQTVLVVCLWMTILTLIVFNAWLRQEIKREQRKIDIFKSHRVSKKIEQKLHRHAYEIKRWRTLSRILALVTLVALVVMGTAEGSYFMMLYLFSLTIAHTNQLSLARFFAK